MSNGGGKDQPRDAEVVVVGAGPGGTTLSYLLARSGVDVMLVERERDLDRTFRGFLFQPLVLKTFDEMGVLDDVLELDHETIRVPTVDLYGRTVSLFDLASYDEEYDADVLMEQPPLLRLLIDRASEYDGFEYRDATTVEDLLVEDGDVVGVEGTDRDAGEDVELRSRLVVGADGRYSTVRTAADVDPCLMESDVELIWFKLPADAVNSDSLAKFNEGGTVGYFGIGDDEAQLGHFVEKGGYERLRSAGIEAFYEEITGVDPSLDGVLQAHVEDFGDTTLLGIEPGVSDRWVGDGLVLIGDAAHVASPVGAQGNGLAITDAVVAHSTICDALPETTGPLPVESLREFERIRRPTVESTLQFQRRGERMLSAFVRGRDRLPASLQKRLVRGLVWLVARSPLSTRAGKRFAWGSWEPVDTAQFVDSR